MAVPIGPPPPDGSYDFDRSWLLWTQSFEGDAVVVVTFGWMAQGYQGVVVRRDGVWEVTSLDVAWTSEAVTF